MSALMDGTRHLVHISCLLVHNGGFKLDPITDLFNTMHVASVVHARLEATAPWGLIREAEDAKEAMPHSSGFKNPPSQLAHFGMVARGNCWLSVKGIPEPTSSHRRRLLPVSAG